MLVNPPRSRGANPDTVGYVSAQRWPLSLVMLFTPSIQAQLRFQLNLLLHGRIGHLDYHVLLKFDFAHRRAALFAANQAGK